MIIFPKKLLVIETTWGNSYIKSLALKMWELIYLRILWPIK